MGISENLFWETDISFLNTVFMDKCAYDDYINYIKEKEYEKRKK